jgi:hypothetical protein
VKHPTKEMSTNPSSAPRIDSIEPFRRRLLRSPKRTIDEATIDDDSFATCFAR